MTYIIKRNMHTKKIMISNQNFKSKVGTFLSVVVPPLVIVLETGTPAMLTLFVSGFIVVGDDIVSVRAATQSSPFKVPMYGECLMPNDLDGMECNVSIA